MARNRASRERASHAPARRTLRRRDRRRPNSAPISVAANWAKKHTQELEGISVVADAPAGGRPQDRRHAQSWIQLISLKITTTITQEPYRDQVCFRHTRKNSAPSLCRAIRELSLSSSYLVEASCYLQDCLPGCGAVAQRLTVTPAVTSQAMISPARPPSLTVTSSPTAFSRRQPRITEVCSASAPEPWSLSSQPITSCAPFSETSSAIVPAARSPCPRR